jgi:hypothetical protein
MVGTGGALNQFLKSREEHGDRPGKAASGPEPGQELAMASKNRRLGDFFAKFDAFFGALVAALLGTQMELKPIPVRSRRRR